MPITRDPLFLQAAEYAVRNKKCGRLLLQHKFQINATRAMSLIEQLQAACVIGAFDGSDSIHPVLADQKFLQELTIAAEETA